MKKMPIHNEVRAAGLWFSPHPYLLSRMGLQRGKYCSYNFCKISNNKYSQFFDIDIKRHEIYEMLLNIDQVRLQQDFLADFPAKKLEQLTIKYALFSYKQDFYKQQQAEAGKKISKC